MARTARYVSATGTDTYANSTNPATPMSLTTAFANASPGDDVYIKADGTYSRTADDTPSIPGTVTQPIRYVGYSATIGDGYLGRTNGNGPLITTNFPLLSYTSTFRLIGGAVSYLIFENLRITGATTATTAQLGLGPASAAINCHVTNAANNGNAIALGHSSNRVAVINCDAFCTGANSNAAIFATSVESRVIGCRASVVSAAACINAAVAAFCTTYAGSSGVTWGTGTPLMLNNTHYNAATQCYLTANAAFSNVALGIIWNCIGTDSGKFLNQQYASGQAWILGYNRTRDNTNADTGLNDWPGYGRVTTDTGGAETDYTNAAGGDFSLIASSPAKGAGIPPYIDIGASQRQEPAASGGVRQVNVRGGADQ